MWGQQPDLVRCWTCLWRRQWVPLHSLLVHAQECCQDPELCVHWSCWGISSRCPGTASSPGHREEVESSVQWCCFVPQIEQCSVVVCGSLLKHIPVSGVKTVLKCLWRPFRPHLYLFVNWFDDWFDDRAPQLIIFYDSLIQLQKLNRVLFVHSYMVTKIKWNGISISLIGL